MSFARRPPAVDPASDPEAGLSLIEILVAMMVFVIFAVAIGYSMTSSLVLARESKSREVAANLAAQEIDYDRATGDAFTLLDRTTTSVVNGVTYSIVRTTHWFSGTDESLGCGTGSGTLKYKRVSVEVSWTGMRDTSVPARANTLIVPKTRINDPALGTIIVSVVSSTGGGAAGIAVSATPSTIANGAMPLTTTPAVTDAQGCTYILKVVPGNYDVTVSKPGYVDGVQHLDSSTTTNVGVAAGSSNSISFLFDDGATFTPSYALLPVLPTNLDVSYINTSGTAYGPKGSVRLHPYASGYQAVAGKYVPPGNIAAGGTPGCVSVDPSAWPTATDGAVGARDPFVPAAPGGSALAPVRMGTLSVNVTGKWVTAVSATGTGTDDPGCTVPMTYTFPYILLPGTSLQLPYGSWTLWVGNSLGDKNSKLGSSAVTLTSRGVVTQTSGVATVTLDPRVIP